MSKSRKGVSSVLSTVLLILITVLGMTVLFSWTTHYFTDFQLKQGSAIMEDLILEDIWFQNDYPDDPQYIILNLYNNGKIDLNITNIYVNGLDRTEFSTVHLDGDPTNSTDLNEAVTATSLLIKMKEHGSIILKEQISILDKVNIKIYTYRTSKFEFNIRKQ